MVVIFGCASRRSVVKTKSDSTSTVKAKLNIDSIGVIKLKSDSIGTTKKLSDSSGTDEREDIFYNKPDSTGKQSVNHKTIYKHSYDKKLELDLGSVVGKLKTDSSAIKKKLQTSATTGVKKSGGTTTVTSTGLNLGLKGWLIVGGIALVAGAICWWKFFM